MISNNLNLNNLRVFESVYRSKSMTLAATELHLTQSGVSQHIKALEDSVGVKLFDRIKQRLVPTSAGTLLYRQCSETLSGLERALDQIRGAGNRLSGKVGLGMPIEFGNNIVLPALAAFGKKHEQVSFVLRYGFATEMYQAILKGELDFAFVDSSAHDRRITSEKVYDETLFLCASNDLLKRLGLGAKEDPKLFEKLEYADYQPGEPVLRTWFEHHFQGKAPQFNVRATAMDVQGIARLILQGLAAGVLPGYLLSKLEKEGHKLHKFKGCGKPLKNSISVAYLAERSQSPAAAASLKWLLSELKSKF